MASHDSTSHKRKEVGPCGASGELSGHGSIKSLECLCVRAHVSTSMHVCPEAYAAQVLHLDGPAIRSANRGDSRESIRKQKLFPQRLSGSLESPQTCSSSAPKRGWQKRGSVREP